MTPEAFIIITLLMILIILLFFNVFRFILNLQRKKLVSQKKASGQVGFVVDTFHDLVTQLKEKEKELELLKGRAEERASSSELYMENIFQSVPSGVVSFDQDLRITGINSAAERILGLEGVEIIGRQHEGIFSSPITEIIEGRRTVERAEISYITHAKKRIWLGLTSSPLRESSGKTIGQILVFTDLTELKAFQSQKELRETLSTLGEMSAGIAHELRNPMAVISGYTKILSKKVDKTLLPSVEAISKEIAGMDRIITDFLSFAKPTELVKTTIDFNELLHSCISAVEGRNKEIKVTLNSVTALKVKGDEVLLRQTIVNLLQNAAEATPDGGYLNISIETEDDSLLVRISDNGYGIPKDIKDKIFLPFYTTKERGTGLGLSIVHKNVISHGGSIQVESGEKGSTFTIRLPEGIIIR